LLTNGSTVCALRTKAIITATPFVSFRILFEAGSGVLTAFVKAGLVTSNGEARRQIKGGGLKINDATVTNEKMTLTLSQLTPEGVIKLSLGRKRHVLLKPV
jgi:tyrosyl-tRNA synthetase